MRAVRREVNQSILGGEPARLLAGSGRDDNEWSGTERRQRLRLPQGVGQCDDLVSHASSRLDARGIGRRSEGEPKADAGQ